MNVLNVRKNKSVTYNLGLLRKEHHAIQGTLMCISDIRFQGMSKIDIWNTILAQNSVNDSIIYIITVTRGSKQLTYVGKTLNTLKKRYPAGPTGGLKLVFDLFREGTDDMLDCVLYNASHPALVELWCYQILVNRRINLANYQDPS